MIFTVPTKSYKPVLFRLIALLFIVVACLLIATAPAWAPGLVGVNTMEGYVSRYHPGHISSREAWELALSDGGAIILDVRDVASYNDYRVAGAINVPPETLGDYAAANLPDKDAVIICYCFCGDRGGSALDVYEQLSELGYTKVFYTEPENEWVYEGAARSEIVTGEEAMAIYNSNPGAVLLDVRSEEEYLEKHIEGSTLIPLAQLESRLSELPDLENVIIVYCKAGSRSATAREQLHAAGYAYVYDMQRVDNWPMGTVEGRGEDVLF
jgi:rhodanese-related sulfurtransferase